MSDEFDAGNGKRTVVLGASPNPHRFAYTAVVRLLENGHTPIPIGKNSGFIGDLPVLTEYPELENIDTVSVYLNRENQKDLYDYILGLNPNRIIFNPGAENEELSKMAENRGIEVLNACTLVMLVTGLF